MALAVCLLHGGCADGPVGADPGAVPRPGEPSGEAPPAVAQAMPDAGAVEEPEPPEPVETRLPVIGGTLIALSDGTYLAAVPDRDAVFHVEPETGVARRIALAAGDEPGRAAEAVDGRAWIALRRTHRLATIDLATGEVSRHDTCAGPRDIAAAPDGTMLVACISGELARHDLSGAVVSLVRVEPDLRDVVIADGRLYVTTFRHAGVLELDDDLSVIARMRPPAVLARDADPEFTGHAFEPNTAWRAVATPGGGVLVAHQQSRADDVSLRVPGGRSGGYGGPAPAPTPEDGECSDSAVVQPAVTWFRAGVAPVTVAMTGAVLPVDVAFQEEQAVVAAAATGLPAELFAAPLEAQPHAFCEPNGSLRRIPKEGGPAVALATSPAGLAVQKRAPDEVRLPDGRRVVLGAHAEPDGSSELFQRAVNRMACASCHPEGGDDGRVWILNGNRRRTPSMRGGLLGSEPFHWDGEMPGMFFLTVDALAQMNADFGVTSDEADALGEWLHALPITLEAATDTEAVARGAEVFESAGCADCHQGPLGEDGGRYLVRDDGHFLHTPRLRDLAVRAPYMVDGCAETLRETFAEGCGLSPGHGDVSELDEADVAALETYLRSR